MPIKKKYIECAKIINTHGCHGALKLESWCNTAEELAELKILYLFESGRYAPKKVKKASVFKQFVIAELEDVDNMDKAISLKNKILYADRDEFQLSEGEYFIADIIGLDVIDAENGTCYGKVSDITNRGASDLYIVKNESGEHMVPSEFVVKTDIENGVYINVIPGLLD